MPSCSTPSPMCRRCRRCQQFSLIQENKVLSVVNVMRCTYQTCQSRVGCSDCMPWTQQHTACHLQRWWCEPVTAPESDFGAPPCRFCCSMTSLPFSWLLSRCVSQALTVTSLPSSRKWNLGNPTNMEPTNGLLTSLASGVTSAWKLVHLLRW